jgi:hypothetical protein
MEDGVVEDMALQGEFGEGEKEGFTPSGLEGGAGVKEEWNESPDVGHGDCLGVEVEQCCCLVMEKGRREVCRRDAVSGGGARGMGILL